MSRKHTPRPIMTPLRLQLLKLASEAGGINAEFISKSEERAAFAMTQMAEPLLRPAYWGPFDYNITDAGLTALAKAGVA